MVLVNKTFPKRYEKLSEMWSKLHESMKYRLAKHKIRSKCEKKEYFAKLFKKKVKSDDIIDNENLKINSNFDSYYDYL